MLLILLIFMKYNNDIMSQDTERYYAESRLCLVSQINPYAECRGAHSATLPSPSTIMGR